MIYSNPNKPSTHNNVYYLDGYKDNVQHIIRRNLYRDIPMGMADLLSRAPAYTYWSNKGFLKACNQFHDEIVRNCYNGAIIYIENWNAASAPWTRRSICLKSEDAEQRLSRVRDLYLVDSAFYSDGMMDILTEGILGNKINIRATLTIGKHVDHTVNEDATKLRKLISNGWEDF